MGWLMAAELRAAGVDLSFAPCVDLDYGVSEVIGDRAFHAKPAAVSQLAVGLHAWHARCGHGRDGQTLSRSRRSVADSHTAPPVDRRELVDMDDDLMPYRRLIANGLPAVMVAHVLFPEVDDAPWRACRRAGSATCCAASSDSRASCSRDDMSMAGAAVAGDIVDALAARARCRLRHGAHLQ